MQPMEVEAPAAPARAPSGGEKQWDEKAGKWTTDPEPVKFTFNQMICIAITMFVISMGSMGIGIGIGMELEKNIRLANQATAKSITTTNLNEVLVSNDTSSTDTDSRRRLARRLTDDGDDSLSELRAANLAKLDFTSMSKIMLTKKNGVKQSFNLESWIRFDDGTVELVGPDKQTLVYPGDGSSPYLKTGSSTRSSSSSRRRRLSDLEDMEVEVGVENDLQMSMRRELWFWDSWWGSTPEETSSECSNEVESECRTCIYSLDSYCQTTWDEYCIILCTEPSDYSNGEDCSDVCNEPIADVTVVVDETEDGPDPVDCKLSDWSASGTCSFVAGSESCQEKYTRTIDTHPAEGGSSCDALEKWETCTCEEIEGDGHVVGDEECDDANTIDGDGCSSTMTVETGWSCDGSVDVTSTCTSTCGDGIYVAGEGCDDGNTEDGDGCDSTCSVETYFTCSSTIGSTTTCDCMRVRKDWRDLTDTEQARYISAVQDLKAAGTYDQFVWTHAEVNNKDYAHGTSGFLPWHRKYLLEYENALRALSDDYSCVTVPYWDWAEDTDICAANGGCTTFDENPSDSAQGSILEDFGGPGDVNCMTAPHGGTVDCDGSTITTYGSTSTCTANGCDGYTTWGSSGASAVSGTYPASAVGCVTTGPFAGWMSPEFGETQSTTQTCLTRGVNWNIASQNPLTGTARLEQIIGLQTSYGDGNSNGFRAFLEGTPHANPHNYLGGHIRSFSSPHDPLFWSHHAFIDKVWAMWQNCHDYDEISTSSLTDTQYAGTGSGTGLDDTMVFNYPNSDLESASTCTDSDTGSACYSCVVGADSWCGSNSWDNLCEEQCQAACASDCGDKSSNTDTPDSVISTWDPTTTTPRDFHSIHGLGSNSYLYAPDQMEDALKVSLDATCDFSETAHHGQEWKGRRRLNPAREKHESKSEPTPKSRRLERFKQANAASRRRLSDDDYYDDDDGASSDACTATYGAGSQYSQNDDGEIYCYNNDVEPYGMLYSTYVATYDTDVYPCYYACECDDAEGYYWDPTYSYCQITDWTHINSNADSNATAEYMLEVQYTLQNATSYVKDADKYKYTADDKLQEYCKLLFNAKSGQTMVDESTVNNSFTNRFLRAWHFNGTALEAQVDKCNGVGPS